MKNKFLIVTTVSDSLPFFKGQIHILKESFDVGLVSSSGMYLDEMCKLHSVLGYKVEMRREIALFHDLVSLTNLCILFYKVKPLVVHGNTPKASLLSMIAAWITLVPKRIYYVHGLRYQGESGIKKRILILMEKISCLLATDVIAVSEGVKNALKNNKISQKPIHLIWNGSVNGIDVEYFNPDSVKSLLIKEKFNIGSEDFVFGFIGRLVGDKGINELVNAFKKINIHNKHTKLLLVGRFENDQDPLKPETIMEIESNSDIIHAGFQKDVRPFFNAMNIFVFPSYREGFGIVLMEAGAMNVPAISTNIIGCNEIILTGKNGFLIKSKDVVELYEKMIFCLNNPEITRLMGTSSRNIVLEKFEQQELWQRTLDVYQKIANS